MNGIKETARFMEEHKADRKIYSRVTGELISESWNGYYMVFYYPTEDKIAVEQFGCGGRCYYENSFENIITWATFPLTEDELTTLVKIWKYEDESFLKRYMWYIDPKMKNIRKYGIHYNPGTAEYDRAMINYERYGRYYDPKNNHLKAIGGCSLNERHSKRVRFNDEFTRELIRKGYIR